jgi:hypothetical protein
MQIVVKEFKGSPDGYTVVDYKVNQEVDLPPDLLKVARAEKWVKDKKAAQSKAAPVVVEPAGAPPAVPSVAESTEETTGPAVQADTPQE